VKQRGQTNIVYLLLLVGIISLLLYSFTGNRTASNTISLNQLADQIKSGNIAKIESSASTVNILYKDRSTAKATIEQNTSFLEQLSLLGVTPKDLASENIEVKILEESSWIGIFSLLSYFLPVIFIALAMYFIFRQTQGGGNSALSFGKSRAKMFEGDHPTVTFSDVAGVDESKEELEEIVEFLKEPQKFTRLGARIPKGVLLVGAKRCWQKPFQAKQACRFSQSAVRNSLRCLLVSAPAACVIFSIRQKRTVPALFSSMKLMRSDASAVPDWAEAMTSGNRR
jgi:cell division protease FtsH